MTVMLLDATLPQLRLVSSSTAASIGIADIDNDLGPLPTAVVPLVDGLGADLVAQHADSASSSHG